MEALNTPVLMQKNVVQHYDWGSKDPSCLVAQISGSQQQPWAELWVGTHPKGESYIQQNETLRQYINKKKLQELKFLFKILSIQKCLSIQVHPNKQQAQKLHKQKPSIYIDSNDKPELFFSLSQFSCFLGFIPMKQFNRILQYEPFKTINQSQLINSHMQTIKIIQFLQKLISHSSQTVQKFIEQLMKNYQLIYSQPQDRNRKQAIKKLQIQFPNDVGIIVSCLLNFNVISAGQCFFIDAGVPHAYFHGQCLELMNSSDNVVRLGLTPKLKDIDTLMQIISDLDEKYLSKILKIQAKCSGDSQIKYHHKQLFLFKITGKSNCSLENQAICFILEGSFIINKVSFTKFQISYLAPGQYQFEGKGQLFIAGSSKKSI